MEADVSYTMDGINIGLTVIFIILNGFFVAAEFAMVKLTRSKVKTMVKEKQPFAQMAMWLFKRQNMALSACQLGITMASLALGWIGEPAIAHLITPLIVDMGFTSDNLIHGIAFTIAFTIITSLHIVVGEQVPKIYAIRRPGPVMLGTSLILKGFYIILYPFMYVLNAITNFFLKWLGITESGEHDTPLTEEEIRSSLSLAYGVGELSKTEHKLLHAVFQFDDEVGRKIMVQRKEVEIININMPFAENIERIKNSNHSRFPLCDNSLDSVIGVIHIKDILRLKDESNEGLKALARSPIFVPENIPLGKLLQEFRYAKQHFAFIQEEHGTILGIITLEDVIEELVGNLQDEFDMDDNQDIQEIEEGTYLVAGDAMIDDINDHLGLNLESIDADTISGLIVELKGHKLSAGLTIEFNEHVSGEITKIEGIRVLQLKLRLYKGMEREQLL